MLRQRTEILAGCILASALLCAADAEPLPKCPIPPLLRGSPDESLGSDGASSDPAPLTIVSLNMHSVTAWETVAPAFENTPQLAEADILLLQEFAQDGSDMLRKAARTLNFHYLFAATQDCEGPGCRQGLAMFSRYPLDSPQVLLLPQNDLKYNNRCRIALQAEVVSPVGPLTLFNLHLDTRVNAGRRVRQLGPVLEATARNSKPAIVAGDFNTANFLWIQSVIPLPWLQRQRRAVRNAMEEHGFSTPFEKTGATFKRFPLKLDWIFLRGLTASAFGLVDAPFSDHRALWTSFEKRPARD